MERFLAHKNNDKEQLLSEHLKNVAALCSSNCIEDLKKIAYFVGMYHDIGKYTRQFQERIRGKEIKVSHANCGAYEISCMEIFSFIKYIAEYCIAGHHTGLPDGGSRIDNNNGTLYSALNSKPDGYEEYKKEIDEITFLQEDLNKYMAIFANCKNGNEDVIELFAFVTKYIFSCLTDADFIDTELFFNPMIKRGKTADFNAALEAVNNAINSKPAETALQNARNSLQKQAWSNFDNSKNIHILNMPTGSGKTLCSVKLALEKAVELNKKKIIYVIPYTAIIEQTAEIFENIFGKYVPILQHHSNFEYKNEANENDDTAEKLKRNCENWDYPFIITTNVQFFESVYGYKGRSLRKLHNMADSIIIFDEFHIMPFQYLQPCMRAIYYICKYLNSHAVLMSATMPDYSTVLGNIINDKSVDYIINDTSDFKYFRKNIYKYIGTYEKQGIIDYALQFESSLIVVNSKKIARELYDLSSDNTVNKFHLSTYMTAEHRSRVISEIKKLLGKAKIMVISTSLIEVGVDLDFTAVFRETAGLDNILQAGGRCNREGKLKNYGNVFVFDFNEPINYRGDLPLNASVVRNLFKEYDNIDTVECIVEYYRRILEVHKDEIKDNSIYKFKNDDGNGFDSIPFRSYSENFKLIDSLTFNVVIQTKESTPLIEKLRNGDFTVKKALNRFSASVKIYELQKLIELGVINDLGVGVAVLTNPYYYNNDVGLKFEDDVNYII